MKVIFLDIDGVLNGHEFDAGAQSCLIKRSCVEQLSHILTQTDAKIVLSSAWRYMITRKAMTLSGFEYMLRTHGVAGISGRLIDTTREDVDQVGKERGLQIEEWIKAHPEVKRYVVVDDMDLGISEKGHPFVQTDSKHGLTVDDTTKILSLIGK